MRQTLLRDSDQMSMAVSLELRRRFWTMSCGVCPRPARFGQDALPHGERIAAEACRTCSRRQLSPPKNGFGLPMLIDARSAEKSGRRRLREVTAMNLLSEETVQKLRAGLKREHCIGRGFGRWQSSVITCEEFKRIAVG